jgi:hypothetical protein
MQNYEIEKNKDYYVDNLKLLNSPSNIQEAISICNSRDDCSGFSVRDDNTIRHLKNYPLTNPYFKDNSTFYKKKSEKEKKIQYSTKYSEIIKYNNIDDIKTGHIISSLQCIILNYGNIIDDNDPFLNDYEKSIFNFLDSKTKGYLIATRASSIKTLKGTQSQIWCPLIWLALKYKGYLTEEPNTSEFYNQSIYKFYKNENDINKFNNLARLLSELDDWAEYALFCLYQNYNEYYNLDISSDIRKINNSIDNSFTSINMLNRVKNLMSFFNPDKMDIIDYNNDISKEENINLYDVRGGGDCLYELLLSAEYLLNGGNIKKTYSVFQRISDINLNKNYISDIINNKYNSENSNIFKTLKKIRQDLSEEKNYEITRNTLSSIYGIDNILSIPYIKDTSNLPENYFDNTGQIIFGDVQDAINWCIIHKINLNFIDLDNKTETNKNFIDFIHKERHDKGTIEISNKYIEEIYDFNNIPLDIKFSDINRNKSEYSLELNLFPDRSILHLLRLPPGNKYISKHFMFLFENKKANGGIFLPIMNLIFGGNNYTTTKKTFNFSLYIIIIICIILLLIHLYECYFNNDVLATNNNFF